MSKLFRYILLLPALISVLQACMKEPDIQPNTNKGNLDALWQIIDRRYCYLDYKNINWDSIYTEYAVRLDTVTNKYGLFDLLGEMLLNLKDGHVNLYSEFDRSRYWKWYTDYPENFNSSLIYTNRYLGNNYRIAGGIRYRKIAGDRIGYMYYSSFSNSFSDANIRSVFEVFAGCKGLIIDVRGNGGGLVSNAALLASYFFDEKKLTSYISHKTGNGHSDFSEPTAVYTEPHKKIKWERPVVILTNRMSYSATNEFVCRMKYAPKATIAGDKTGGGGGLPLSSELPNGWMVRFSASPMYDAGMINTEWGIDPDVKVNLSKQDEANGYDTIIEKAVSLILD
ncbi:MAG: S41 family peptidase [Paludibacteraceae bacterium]|nr:S41 family peptidase [Paludibacteraceae bacterium]